jgi:hypothetical protein
MGEKAFRVDEQVQCVVKRAIVQGPAKASSAAL